MKTPIWLLLAGITSLSLIFPGCDRGQEATSAPNGSWKASFRVESGELTTSQMASASWVRVAASRSGVVVAYNETFYSDHQVGLKIPDAGAVDIKLTGYNDQNKTTVMWTGTGTIANGAADPGPNILALGARPSGVQGVCPTGGHGPSDAEWTTMQTVVDPTNTTDGTKLKSTSGWNSSGNGTDTYGFRALPGDDHRREL